MPLAIRVIDKVAQLADWNQATFGDGMLPKYDAATQTYVGSVVITIDSITGNISLSSNTEVTGDFTQTSGIAVFESDMFSVVSSDISLIASNLTLDGNFLSLIGSAISITGDSVDITAASGPLTLTSATAATWSTITGTLSLSGFSALNLQINEVTKLAVTSGNITVQAGVTLDTTGTGNINLPNNASAKFKIEGTAVGATVTAANLDTLTNGSNADSLHTHTVLPSTQLVISGLTTTGLANGDFGYVSANNVITKTDALAISSSRVIGVNKGTIGSMSIGGIVEDAKFTTVGGSPSPGAAVYLARSTDEASAVGKLTATPPTTEVLAEVGICLDNSNYAGSKTCKIILQVKAPVVL